jgi:hypothetical protein
MRGLKIIFAALMLSAALAPAAKADGDIGISFGYDDAFTGFDPCDYYRYYDTAPPWGLPDDYCNDLVSFDPVYYDGFWYRGPIYHRHHHGKEEVWLHGGWREDGWSGKRPAAIAWQDRGGSLHGFRADFHPGRDARGGGEGLPHADGVHTDAVHTDAVHAGAGSDAHGGNSPPVHGADVPAVRAGGDAPVVHSGGEAPSVHAGAPSSGESHGSSGGGGSGSGHDSGSGGGHDSSSGGSHH